MRLHERMMGYEYHGCISGIQGMAGAGVKICQKVILDASGAILLLFHLFCVMRDQWLCSLFSTWHSCRIPAACVFMNAAMFAMPTRQILFRRCLGPVSGSSEVQLEFEVNRKRLIANRHLLSIAHQLPHLPY